MKLREASNFICYVQRQKQGKVMVNSLAEERKIKLKCLPINKKQTISPC